MPALHLIHGRAHRLYAVLFVILIWCWPFWVFHGLWPLVIAHFLNLLVYGLVVYYMGSKEQTFWRGLCALAASFESGCVNVTFLYILFVLAYYYIRMVLAAFIGWRESREWSQQWWIETVSGRFSSEDEYYAALRKPRWFS